MQAAAAPADCREAAAETAQLLQGLADRELLGATFAIHYKDCGFAYEQASRPLASQTVLAVAAGSALPCRPTGCGHCATQRAQ